ncbi:MAG: DUF4249 domain-containing protein [Mucilaginibacter sp.]
MERKEEMNIKQIGVVVLLGSTIAWGCKKLYSPRASSITNSFLVVEGVITAGDDSTIFNLGRTVQLTDTIKHRPEVGAKVTVDDGQGAVYSLTEVDTGRYAAAPLHLDNTHKYRLNISTTDGQTYASDYVPVKVTPPIDTLSTPITGTGLDIDVSAHDPSNSTRYYRWEYSETYIYQSNIETQFIFDPANPDTLQWSAIRTPEQQIHTCYVKLNSSTININSSAALSGDVISNSPVTQIPKDSEKLLHRYSILVKQYALTQEAYNFWNLLKNNTEKIGTIFDVQPSTNNGNIHCTSNTSQPVIGYVSASTISQKRIFVDRAGLPAWPIAQPEGCNPDPTKFKPNFICWRRVDPGKNGTAVIPQELQAGIYIPIGPISATSECYKESIRAFSVPTAYYSCVDCRYHLGGKTVKPDFWK